jgi:hypothetical protein
MSVHALTTRSLQAQIPFFVCMSSNNWPLVSPTTLVDHESTRWRGRASPGPGRFNAWHWRTCVDMRVCTCSRRKSGNNSLVVVTALETATMSHVTTSEVGIKPPLLASTWTFSLQLCILSTNRHYASPLRPLFLCCHIIQSSFPSLPGTAFKNIPPIYRRYLQFKILLNTLLGRSQSLHEYWTTPTLICEATATVAYIRDEYHQNHQRKSACCLLLLGRHNHSYGEPTTSGTHIQI